MGTIIDLIRYGFAGYLLITTLIVSLYRINYLPINSDFYKNFGGIIGATILIVGPILGFVIHQIYFVYFEKTESYVKLTRKCLKTLYNYHLKSHEVEISETDRVLAKKACYLVWKYMMTGMMGDLKVSDVILSRLTSLRNYSHAFGAIVTSGIISIVIYIVIAITLFESLKWNDLIVFVSLIFIVALFGYQRQGLIQRIEEIEDGIMKLEIDRFHKGLDQVIDLEKSIPNK